MAGIDTYEPRWAAGLRLLAGACGTAGDAAQGRHDAALAAGDADAAAAAAVIAAHARDAGDVLRGAAEAAQIGGRWGGCWQGEAWADWPARCADALRRLAGAMDAGMADMPERGAR